MYMAKEKTEDVEVTAIVDISTNDIQKLVYVIRGRQVMIDSDLAMLYKVDTGNLNRAMKRNIKRFPEEFCFQLTKKEYDNLRFQIGISSESEYGGRRYMPYVYTEQGIAMLSAVLHSDVAIQVSIRIMQTFVEMRKYLATNALLLQKVNNLEAKQLETDIALKAIEQQTSEKFDEVFDYIASREEDNQKIFFDGQIFDAFSIITELIQKADKRIILIDGYVDIVTLNILAKKKDSVDVVCYVLPNARITKQDIINFNAQYPNLEVRKTTVFHDRYLILDDTIAYHIGASINDAGKKCFGINKIEDEETIKNLIKRAEETGR